MSDLPAIGLNAHLYRDEEQPEWQQWQIEAHEDEWPRIDYENDFA